MSPVCAGVYRAAGRLGYGKWNPPERLQVGRSYVSWTHLRLAQVTDLVTKLELICPLRAILIFVRHLLNSQAATNQHMIATHKLILALFVFSSPWASGASVVFQFGGVIQTSSFSGPSYPISWTTAGGVVGQSISIIYAFESSTLDSNALSNVGFYSNSVTSASLSFNGYQSTFTPSTSRIDIGNNVGAGPFDSYDMRVDGVPSAAFLSLRLLDGTAAVFTDDTLPTTLNLSNFLMSSQGQLDGPGGAFSPTLRFTITSVTVIPEPGTLTLVGGGALILLRRRRESHSNLRTSS